MIERRMRKAEARLIWTTGKAVGLNPVAVVLFIAVNAISRSPLVRITHTTNRKRQVKYE